MNRITIKCLIEGCETQLQLDKKAMPGEPGLCFMISAEGCFKGYISRQKNGRYQPIGAAYYSMEDLLLIGEELKQQIKRLQGS